MTNNSPRLFEGEIPGSPTQAMSHVLAQIGENSVLLLLSLLAFGKNWEASKVISEGGYDLLLSQKSGKGRIKIEVKTRQTILTTQGRVKYVSFDLTPNERNACDFLVGYWWDESAYFVVPKAELKKVLKNKNTNNFVYRHRARRNQEGIISDGYLNNLELIGSKMK